MRSQGLEATGPGHCPHICWGPCVPRQASLLPAQPSETGSSCPLDCTWCSRGWAFLTRSQARRLLLEALSLAGHSPWGTLPPPPPRPLTHTPGGSGTAPLSPGAPASQVGVGARVPVSPGFPEGPWAPGGCLWAQWCTPAADLCEGKGVFMFSVILVRRGDTGIHKTVVQRVLSHRVHPIQTLPDPGIPLHGA